VREIMNYMNTSGIDYRLNWGGFSNLPKWARDEQLYNCELKDKLITKKGINWLKQLSMFLF